MALAHSPKIVTDSLLLCLDLGNSKKFTDDLGSGNLVQNFNYNAATWSNIFTSAATITTDIDAPDGSKTAVRFTCNNTDSSLLRVGFTTFSANGTDSYAVSFWVRMVGGNTASGNALTCDLQDGLPSGNYLPQLVLNKWVRVVFTGIPAAGNKTFFDILSNRTNNYILDFWGVKIENITASANPYPIKDLISGSTFNIYKPQYTTLTQDSITFDRSVNPDPKHGGTMLTTGTGALTSSNFLYNDHTWEVWFRIDDIQPLGITTEGFSTLAVYRGYHAGYLYNSSQIRYSLWNGSSSDLVVSTWTLGTSGTQVVQGQWFNISVTRSGNVFTPYLNGVQSGNTSTNATTLGNPTSSSLHLGAAQLLGEGSGSFLYYSKNTVSNMKMYNRALSADEILQNFNAYRGRFGI